MGTTNAVTVEDDERVDAAMGLGRMLALSDGIFAIAMTLLAFQIQPPDLRGRDVHQLARALGALGDRYYVFALSFWVIGMIWLGHHRLFRSVERADEALMVINLLFLMTVAALPFHLRSWGAMEANALRSFCTRRAWPSPGP